MIPVRVGLQKNVGLGENRGVNSSALLFDAGSSGCLLVRFRCLNRCNSSSRNCPNSSSLIESLPVVHDSKKKQFDEIFTGLIKVLVYYTFKYPEYWTGIHGSLPFSPGLVVMIQQTVSKKASEYLRPFLRGPHFSLEISALQ